MKTQELKSLITKVLESRDFTEKEKVTLVSAVTKFFDENEKQGALDELEDAVLGHLRTLKSVLEALTNDPEVSEVVEEYIFRVEDEFDLFKREG